MEEVEEGLERINQILIILFDFSRSLFFVSISVCHCAKNPGAHARTMEGSEVRAIFLHLLNAPEMSAQ